MSIVGRTYLERGQLSSSRSNGATPAHGTSSSGEPTAPRQSAHSAAYGSRPTRRKKPRPLCRADAGASDPQPLQEEGTMSTLQLPTGSAGLIGNMDPLSQAVIGFLATYKNPKTRAQMQQNLEVFVRWCYDQEPIRIEPLQAKRVHIHLYLRWLEQQPWLAESTISTRFTAVSRFYLHATIDGLVEKDPTLGVEKPTVDGDKQKRTFLNPVQLAHFLQVAEKYYSQSCWPLIALLALRGMRIAEACSLNVDSLSMTGGQWVITYISKGDKVRRHPLAPQVAVAVQSAIGTRDIGPVLLNHEGRRMTRKNADSRIKIVARHAGVPTDISPHSLRRSFITAGYAMGIPGEQIQATVGHASLATTARYNRLAGSIHNDRSADIAGHLANLAG